MKRVSTILLGALLGAPALAAEPPPVPLQGDIIAGKALYDQHCQKCHGADGKGGDAPRLTDSGRLNALSNERFLNLLREGGSWKPKKERHQKLPSSVSVLDTWDIIGFLRHRSVEIPTVFPDADRYIAAPYTPDQYALERLKKSTGKDFTSEQSTFQVFTVYKTGWGGQTVLLPNDPKTLDKLKRNMKQGYVVVVPMEGQKQPTDLVVALEPKNLSIMSVRALTKDGQPLPDLDKQLERFVGKGDRRVSGTAKARLKAGGGGKAYAALEEPITEAFVRAAEAVTAYEIQERERSWADDDF